MKKKYILGLLLFTGFSVMAQPRLTWQKALGGVGYDAASAIRQTTDGGYVIAGSAASRGGDVIGIHSSIGQVLSDYWIVRLNADGILQWQKCLGSSLQENANDIQQTADGGYIVAGYSSAISNGQDVTGIHGANDFWVVKLYNNGNIQWQKCFGGSSDDYAYSIKQTADGGYIIAGGSYSNDGDVTGNHGGFDYLVIKLDNNGNLQWQKMLGGSKDDFARSIQQTSDGGYIVAGYSYSADGNINNHHGTRNYDYWVVKLGGSGNLQWQRSYGGSRDDIAYAIQQTTDGGYIVTGFSMSNNGDASGNHGDHDVWILKIGSSGNVQWQRSAGGKNIDEAKSIQQTTDGGYIVAGYSRSDNGDARGNHGDFDYWILKLTATGIISWQKCMGGSNPDYAYSVRQTNDDGYIVAGATLSNNGDVTGQHGASDYWIVKLGNSGNLQVQPKGHIQSGIQLDIYPNPATDVINFRVDHLSKKLKLDISDAGGKHIQQVDIHSANTRIPLSRLTAGIYYYKLADEHHVLYSGSFFVE